MENSVHCLTLRSIRIAVLLNVRFFLTRVKRLQELSKLAIPRRDNDRHGTVGFRLTSESNQRLRLSSIDIAELFDLLSLAHGHIGKLFSTAKHSHPTRTA